MENIFFLLCCFMCRQSVVIIKVWHSWKTYKEINKKNFVRKIREYGKFSYNCLFFVIKNMITDILIAIISV